MRINGFRCDGCGKEHLIDPNLQPDFYRNVPPDWFIVTIGGNFDPHGEPLLFCSKKCLREHPLHKDSEVKS